MKQPKQPSRLSLWFCRHLLLLDGVSIAAMLAGALVKEYLSRPIPRPVNALCGVLVFGGVGGLILFTLLAMPAMALHCPNCGTFDLEQGHQWPPCPAATSLSLLRGDSYPR